MGGVLNRIDFGESVRLRYAPLYMGETRMFRKQHPATGSRPGTLTPSADASPTRLRIHRYDKSGIEEIAEANIESIDHSTTDSSIYWIDVQGLRDVELLQSIADRFTLHPLAIEDIVNVPQRPKVDPYDDHLVIICRNVSINHIGTIRNEQLSVVVGRNYVLTFQQSHGDVLAPVLHRLGISDSRLRNNGSGYLTYAILDTVIDGYYPTLEKVGEIIETLEEEVLERPTPALLKEVNLVKSQLVNLRRSVWPQREMLSLLSREPTSIIDEHVCLFLRDTYDHCVQSSDVIEMYRDMTTGLLNTYLSAVGHRTNEVMKTLTIMSSIFIPLTFLAGIYGMNFEHMPELRLPWAYPMVWITMFVMVFGMLIFFYRRGWLGGGRRGYLSLLKNDLG